MSVYLLALLIGIIAGLRMMTALAAISWAAHLGRLPGAKVRSATALAIGRNRPAAPLEELVAVSGAAWIVAVLP
jgi:uncharacterized membrane protein